MRRLARLVTRNSDSHDGLILGVMLKEGADFFKKGHVYELGEVLGEVTIREVGPSWIKETVDSGRTFVNEDGNSVPVRNQVCWGNTAGHVLDVGGKHVFLSEDEYLQLCGV